MKHLRLIALLLIPASFAAACSDDGDSESIESICQRGCAKSATLDCPNEPADCAGECADEFRELPSNCSNQSIAYAKCLADGPASTWECDGDGEASPETGSCPSQLAALQQCIVGGGGAGG